jgi:hypothetical protein
MLRQPDVLFAMLGEGPPQSEEAAEMLLRHPEWLVGTPPVQVMEALRSIGPDLQSAVFRLGRQWPSQELSAELLKDFSSRNEANEKEHTAWLIKHLIGPAQWSRVAQIALSHSESTPVRRSFVEALDRLAFAGHLGWNELRDVIGALRRSPDSAVREGVVGVLMSLEDSSEKLTLLTEMLDDDGDFVVAGALQALAQMKNVTVDESVLERLRNHPSLLVRDRAEKVELRSLRNRGSQ